MKVIQATRMPTANHTTAHIWLRWLCWAAVDGLFFRSDVLREAAGRLAALRVEEVFFFVAMVYLPFLQIMGKDAKTPGEGESLSETGQGQA